MHKGDEDPQPIGKPYAVDEITFPTLGKAAVLLIIFTIFSSVLASGAYWLFVVHETVPPAHVLETTPVPPDPTIPILQKDPVAEIRKFRADEYDAERSYSHWKDGDGKTSLRIPISRAMEIVKVSGLPRPVQVESGAHPARTAPGSFGPALRGNQPITIPATGPLGPGSSATTGGALGQAPGMSGGAVTSERPGAAALSNSSGQVNPASGPRP